MTLLFKYNLIDLGFNVFCNLFASLILITIMVALFSPKIKVSPYIVGQHIEGKRKFIFKIVNPTLFTFTDVKISLNILSYYPEMNNNLGIKRETLKLTNENIVLPRRKLFGTDRFSQNSVQISTDYDIEKVLGNEYCSIELAIDLTHPVNLSATPKGIFIMQFADLTCIKMGRKFIFGSSIETT